MIDRYKSRVPEFGPKHKDTQALVGDLLSDPVEPQAQMGSEFTNFDLIAVGAALHAFPKPGHAIKVLAERLAPGGVLYVQDKFDNGYERGKDTKGPKGFTEAGIRELMTATGLGEFAFELVEGGLEVELPSEDVVGFEVFVAKAKKMG